MKIQDLEIPIRSLMASEIEELYASNSDGKLFQLAVVDADTKQPVYTVDDIPSLNEMDGAIAVPLRVAIQEHCGINISLDDVLKNSEPIT